MMRRGQVFRLLGVLLLLGTVGMMLSQPALARKKEKKLGVHNLAQVNTLAIVVDPTVFKRDNLDQICSGAIAVALQENDFKAASDSLDADAILALRGSSLTITQGRANEIGRTVLNYVATVELGNLGKVLFTAVGGARGDTAAEACNIAAEDIAGKLAEAKDDTDEDDD
jgi:hypothetical protein